MSAATEREAQIREAARAVLAARAHVHLGRALPVGAPPTPTLVTEEPVSPDIKAWEEAVEQVRRAKETLARPATDYLPYPFASLADLVGGVAPGRVHYYVSASNNGKTTFVRSFLEAAIAAGQRCAVMTTETTPDDFRKSMAAVRLGYDFGDIATGAVHTWPNGADVIRAVTAEMDRMQAYEEGAYRALKISDAHGYLTAEKVRLAAREAADLGVDWFIVDHVDHVEGDARQSDYQVSNAVNTAAWRAALDLDLRVLCTSQLNQDLFRHNTLGLCVPPQESWVKFGGKKKEIAWVMLAGYRPLRPFVDEEARKRELDAYRAGERKIADITLPALKIRVMKHRDYGARVGAACVLEYRAGRLHDVNQDLYRSTRAV